MGKLRKYFIISGICALAMMLFTGCQIEAAANVKSETQSVASEKTMVLSFINIGKGDAFLLKMPEGGYYMCDTGKASDFEEIKAVLDQKQVVSLKGIFLSHGHKDHAGGLEQILENYPTEKVYVSAKDEVSYKKINVEEIATTYGAKLCRLEGGEKIDLEGVTAHVWIPNGCDRKNENNNSMVIRFVYGDNACLMTGDMEGAQEDALLSSGVELKADVLKLGHHGEDDATSNALLDAVAPVYGLITGNAIENEDSVNGEITARLQKHDIEYFYSEGKWLALDFEFNKKDVKMTEFMGLGVEVNE